MRKISALTFVSLDGVAQGPVQPDEDTSGGFTQSGWAFDYMGEAMDLVNSALMEEPVSFLFGRKTFQMFANHWPDAPVSDHGRLLNNSQKYVASTSLEQVTWQNSQIIKSDIVSELQRIKQKDGPRLQIHGSLDLIQSLLAHNLIDEFRLLTFPVVLGAGRRLFQHGCPPTAFSHNAAKVSPGGVVMGVYQRQTQ